MAMSATEEAGVKTLLLQQLDRILDDNSNRSRKIPALSSWVCSHDLRLLIAEWLNEAQHEVPVIARIRELLSTSSVIGASPPTAVSDVEISDRDSETSSSEHSGAAVIDWAIAGLNYQLSAYRAAVSYAKALGEASTAKELLSVMDTKVALLKRCLRLVDQLSPTSALSWRGQC